MNYLNNIKNNIPYIKKSIANKKLETGEYRYPSKDLQSVKNLKKYAMLNIFKHHRSRDISEERKKQSSTINRLNNFWNKLHVLQNNKKVELVDKFKTENVLKGFPIRRPDYKSLNHFRTSQMNQNKIYEDRQRRKKVYREINQNLKEKGVSNVGLGKILNTVQRSFKFKNFSTKQTSEISENLVTTIIKTTEETNYFEIFSQQLQSKRKEMQTNKVQATNIHGYSDASIIYISLSTIVLLIVLILVLVRFVKKKNLSKKVSNTKKRMKRKFKNERYSEMKDDAESYSFEEESGKSTDDQLNRKNLIMHSVPKMQAQKQTSNVKEVSLFVPNSQDQQFFLPKYNLEDKLSSISDETVISLNSNSSSIQNDKFIPSNPLCIANGLLLNDNSNKIFSRKSKPFTSSLEKSETVTESSSHNAIENEFSYSLGDNICFNLENYSSEISHNTSIAVNLSFSDLESSTREEQVKDFTYENVSETVSSFYSNVAQRESTSHLDFSDSGSKKSYSSAISTFDDSKSSKSQKDSGFGTNISLEIINYQTFNEWKTNTFIISSDSGDIKNKSKKKKKTQNI